MKTKLTILFAALLALCGCDNEINSTDNLGEKGRRFLADRVPGAHKEPPAHCEILCDGDGHFTVLMDEEYTFVADPVYDTRQAAVDRAWKSYRPYGPKKLGTLESFNWHVCREETK